VQASRGEEERNEQPFCHTPHPGHDVTAHPVGQPRQRSAEQQGTQGTVQTDFLGSHHHQKEPAKQQPERQFGGVQEALQERDDLGKQLGRYEPGNHCEANDFQQQNEHPGSTQAVLVFADGNAHYQQAAYFRDNYDGEYPEPDQFFEQVLVGQYFGHNAEAG
jgi:hypothetical protein